MSSFLARRAAFSAPQLARSFGSTSVRPSAKITLIGTLGKSPELVTSNNNNEYITYPVASQSRERGEDKVQWFKVLHFRGSDGTKDYLQSIPKGSLVHVEGDLQVSKFSDDAGIERTSIAVIQRNMEVLRRSQPRRDEGQEE